jgi:phospholipid/cholesterol/gamma-HCH transport system substrate-binding protein
MKRDNEFSVGLVIVIAVVAIVAAGLWLGQVGPRGPKTLQVALFRTVGGVKVGDPVVLRGVRVGRVEAIRLAKDDWVETDLRMTSPDELPPNPVAIAVSASLFGEWQVAVMDSARAPDDPEVRRALAEARLEGGERLPGATLPDVGQLTAQASRIASDIAVVTNRVSGAIDSQSIVDIRSSVQDLRKMADRLSSFTQLQTNALDSVVTNATNSSTSIASASQHLQATLSRVDSSTSSGELNALVKDARSATADLKAASSDFRSLAAAANKQRDNLVHILIATDSVLSRLEKGQGTLGMLSQDSTLYREMTKTVVQLRSLLADVQANPRRYFRFSVF